MKWILTAITIAVIISCRAGYESDDCKLITCDLDCDYKPIGDYVSHVNYLVLEESKDNVIGKIDKVIMDDERIYVGDYKSRKIHIYKTDGTYIGCINRYGRGPGEYSEIRDFTLDSVHIYVLDNITDKVMVFNKDNMSFVKVLKLPFNAWDFEVLNNGGFVFAYAPQIGHINTDSRFRYKLIITDSELKIRQRYFNYKNKDADALAFKNYLSSYGDYIAYSTFAEGGYHLLSKQDGTIISDIIISIPKQVPLSERSNISAISMDKYSYQYNAPIMCKNYMAFKFSSDGIAYDYFLDTHSYDFFINSPTATGNIFGIVGSYKDLYISYWGSGQAYEMMTKKGFPEAPDNIERQIIDDASYVVLYQMK